MSPNLFVADFRFSTDSVMDLVSWEIQVVEFSAPDPSIRTRNSFVVDAATPLDAADLSSGEIARELDNPGTWSNTAVPEPPTLPLLLAGLVALFWLSWRRRAMATTGLAGLGFVGWRRRRERVQLMAA